MEPDQLDTPDTEITAELWDSTPDPSGDDDTPNEFAPEPEQPTDSEPAAEKTAEPEQEPEKPAEPDPYAGLPEPVRNALAAIPQFEQRMRSAEGRVAALQRELAQRPQAPAPQPEAPKPTALDAIRAELPEVVAAIEEARGQAIDTAALREQIKAEAIAALQEEQLNDARPNWATEVISPEFQAWLGAQPVDYAQKVKNTDKARVLTDALTKFDAARAASQQKQAVQDARQRRMTAAVTPASARRAPSKDLDALTDDEYWAEITKDG